MIDFAKNYVDDLIKLLQNIDFKVVESIQKALEETKGKIYIIGNGGSLATASHMANDLGIGLKRRELQNFNVHSLGDNSAICSAIANDTGYENIFYLQLKNILTKDDLLIAISCSGNSSNITKALHYAKEVGTKIVGVSGFDGGELKKLSDISFHIQTKHGEYGKVEDLHMMLNHILYSYYTQAKQ